MLRASTLATLVVSSVVCLPQVASAEEKPGHYWVFFADKDIASSSVAQIRALAGVELTPRALKRRAKVRHDGLVDIRDLPVARRHVEAVEATGAEIRVASKWLNAVSVEADASELARIRALASVVDVRRVAAGKRDPVIIEDITAPLPASNNVWQIDYGMSEGQLNTMNVPVVHECGLTGEGVLLGVLDSGFDLTHPALAGVDVVAQYDFINDDDFTGNEAGDSSDQHNHGTSVLSLIASNVPGTYVGSAPGVSVLLAKTEDVPTETQVEEDYYVAAIEWMEGLGADASTSSLGYIDWYEYEDFDGQTAPITIALEMAIANGLIALTAMGNEGPGTGTLAAPADGAKVLSIGATNIAGTIAGFSSRGPTADGRVKPEVVAPGQGVIVANSGGSYGSSNGTSFSTPLTAGLVALIIQSDPDITPDEMRDRLMSTADNAATPDNNYGSGMVNGGLATEDYCNCTDADMDGHPDQACGGGDCNDADVNVNPDATEVCDDMIDNDCDGLVDGDDDACGGTTGGDSSGEGESGGGSTGDATSSSSDSSSSSDTTMSTSSSDSSSSSSDSGSSSSSAGTSSSSGGETSTSAGTSSSSSTSMTATTSSTGSTSVADSTEDSGGGSGGDDEGGDCACTTQSGPRLPALWLSSLVLGVLLRRRRR